MNYIALTAIPLLALVAELAHADAPPVLYPKCPQSISINPVPGGNGVFFDESCKIVYVLPPARGSVQLESVIGSETLSMCDEVDDVIAGLADISQKIAMVGQPAPAAAPPARPRLGRQPRVAPTPAPTPSSADNNGELTPAQEKERLDLLQLRQDKLQAILKRFDHTVAAKAQLTFSANTNDLVAAYQAANASSGIQFRALPIKSATLSFKPADPATNDFPIVLSSAVGGVSVSGNAAPGTPASVNFGSAVGGEVELSLFGACPFRNSATNRLPRSLSAAQLSASIVPTVQYTYELQSTYGYTAEFNRGALARSIRESSTSGGFFRTSSVSSLTEDQASQSWFKFHSDCSDSRACPSYDSAIVEKIRSRLLDEVLSGISLSTIGRPMEMISAAAPPTAGSRVAADGLRSKDCDSKYCKYGAFVLDVLSATVGGASKTDSYIKTNDHWAKEDVHDQRMLEFSSSMAFGPKHIGDL